MRDILFRGKRIDNGEWVEGFFYEDADKKAYILSCPRDFGFADSHKVDPDTVGQYTGLTDKNGKKIFEGDILVSAWNTKVAIFFDEDYLQFRARDVSCGCENNLHYYDNGKMEIIGNIHDNPELVKEN